MAECIRHYQCWRIQYFNFQFQWEKNLLFFLVHFSSFYSRFVYFIMPNAILGWMNSIYCWVATKKNGHSRILLLLLLFASKRQWQQRKTLSLPENWIRFNIRHPLGEWKCQGRTLQFSMMTYLQLRERESGRWGGREMWPRLKLIGFGWILMCLKVFNNIAFWWAPPHQRTCQPILL